MFKKIDLPDITERKRDNPMREKITQAVCMFDFDHLNVLLKQWNENDSVDRLLPVWMSHNSELTAWGIPEILTERLDDPSAVDEKNIIRALTIFREHGLLSFEDKDSIIFAMPHCIKQSWFGVIDYIKNAGFDFWEPSPTYTDAVEEELLYRDSLRSREDSISFTEFAFAAGDVNTLRQFRAWDLLDASDPDTVLGCMDVAVIKTDRDSLAFLCEELGGRFDFDAFIRAATNPNILVSLGLEREFGRAYDEHYWRDMDTAAQDFLFVGEIDEKAIPEEAHDRLRSVCITGIPYCDFGQDREYDLETVMQVLRL